MKEVTAYTCEFCPRRRALLSAKRVAKHEAYCSRNPATRSCLSCLHFYTERDSDAAYGRLNCCKLEIDNSSLDLPRNCDKWEPMEVSR